MDDVLGHLSASQTHGTKVTKRAHLSPLPEVEGGEGGGGHASSAEEWYIGDLIRRLQIHVRLHDPGVVRVVLTIKRDGSLGSLTVSTCPSSETKRALEKEFPKIKFAPFGKAFYNASEYTFRLRLEDTGVWVTS